MANQNLHWRYKRIASKDEEEHWRQVAAKYEWQHMRTREKDYYAPYNHSPREMRLEMEFHRQPGVKLKYPDEPRWYDG